MPVIANARAQPRDSRPLKWTEERLSPNVWIHTGMKNRRISGGSLRKARRLEGKSASSEKIRDPRARHGQNVDGEAVTFPCPLPTDECVPVWPPLQAIDYDFLRNHADSAASRECFSPNGSCSRFRRWSWVANANSRLPLAWDWKKFLVHGTPSAWQTTFAEYGRRVLPAPCGKIAGASRSLNGRYTKKSSMTTRLPRAIHGLPGVSYIRERLKFRSEKMKKLQAGWRAKPWFTWTGCFAQ